MSVNWTKIKHEIETKFSSYAVACSSGVDSQFILDLVSRCNIRYIVLHFKHNNHENDERDANFVSDYCSSRGIPFLIGEGDGD